MAKIDRVLIAGGGPIGSVAGLRLAQQGIPVTVFDRLDKPAEDHRAATLQPSTLDLFEPLGLTDEILRQGLRSPIFQWRDRVTQEVVAEFDYGVVSDESGHPYVIQLEQHRTVHVVLEAAKKVAEFTMIRPAEIISVRQEADFVEAEARMEDGTIERHRGRYLIGCDGGRSIVRKAIGASFEGFTWPERFNIIAVPFDFETAMGFRLRNYCAHPDRWVSLMKVPGEDFRGLWRCLFPAKTEESDEEVMSDEWIQARFAECLPAGAPYKVVHRNMYAVHQRVAGGFRSGRILLAGDAAHVNNPIGGMGMNSGFQDALNVADKLASIWQGADADELLDRYDRQRRLTAIEYVQAQSIANKRTLEERDPDKRRQNLDNLRRMADDPKLHHDFVRRSSLIAMLRSAEAIE
jgi:2-polyprenyl-6-methoxyphenol hydroxylase-like FAD-dependent oxidoreductase